MVLAGAVAGEQDPVHAAAALVRGLRAGKHYEVAEDGRSVAFTDAGPGRRREAELGGIDLYDDEHVEQLSAVNVALHAHALLHRDVDYIVRDGAVELIDEMRGRVAQRRRWPDGLQAAVEAKEGLDADRRGRGARHDHRAGVHRALPDGVRHDRHRGARRRPAARVLQARGRGDPAEHAVRPRGRAGPDLRHPRREGRGAGRRDRRRATTTGRPVLVGTLDVKESESLADGAARRRRARASCSTRRTTTRRRRSSPRPARYGAVTVSTQMAGRGVDIRLGGSDQADRERVAELGGLYVIGSGRHDSRRVDDQLRGRAGRQGDPGGSVFFVSLEDDLVSRHAADAVPPSPRMNADGLVTDDAGRLRGRARPAGRRGRQPRDPPQHLALQRGDRAAAQGPRRAPRAAADHRRRRGDAAGAVRRRRPSEIDEDLLVRRGPVDRALPPRPALGRAPGRAVRGARGRAPARAGPARPARRVPPGRGAGVQRAGPGDRGAHRRDVRGDRVRPTTGSRTARKLVRPSATWTYLVHDNPFGSELDRLIAAIGRRLSSGG